MFPKNLLKKSQEWPIYLMNQLFATFVKLIKHHKLLKLLLRNLRIYDAERELSEDGGVPVEILFHHGLPWITAVKHHR